MKAKFFFVEYTETVTRAYNVFAESEEEAVEKIRDGQIQDIIRAFPELTKTEEVEEKCAAEFMGFTTRKGDL